MVQVRDYYYSKCQMNQKNIQELFVYEKKKLYLHHR